MKVRDSVALVTGAGSAGCDEAREHAVAKRYTDVNLLINNAGLSLWKGFLGPDSVSVRQYRCGSDLEGHLHSRRL
jgi:hypothetical protein